MARTPMKLSLPLLAGLAGVTAVASLCGCSRADFAERNLGRVPPNAIEERFLVSANSEHVAFVCRQSATLY
jgi:hypothetical protein